MSTEKNRKTALAFFQSITDGALDPSFLADDVKWWVPTYGTLSMEEIGAIGVDFMAQFKSNPKMTVQGVTADGDRVAIESISRGEGINGKIYENSYHFLLVFREGRICLIKEYLDTAYVARFSAD